MKLFEILGKIRFLTKKSPLLRKIIDFFPILRNLDQSAFVYSRIKSEEYRLLTYLAANPRPKIRLVCDLRCTPPTYGDFAAFLMAIRIISIEFELTFVLVANDLQSDWDKLSKVNQMTRISEFQEMARRVTNASSSQFKFVQSFTELSTSKDDGLTIFSDYIYRRKKIYWDLKYLNDLLFAQFECSREVLLDHVKFSENKKQPVGAYITWHVRRESLWANQFDSSDEEFVEQCNHLRKLIGNQIQIIVVASNEGILDLMKLASKLELQINSARDYSENFLGDVSLIHNSLCFIQVGGGGISEYAHCSSIPYLDFDYPLAKNNITRKKLFGVEPKKSQMTSWQTENQKLLLTTKVRKTDFYDHTLEFLNDLKLNAVKDG